MRLVIGYASSPILPGLLYAWLAWEGVFTPMIYIVMLAAYLLAILLLLPAHLFIFKIKKYNIYISSCTCFVLLFLIFLFFYIAMGSNYSNLEVGDKVLVDEGGITSAGYFRAVQAALIVGLHGVMGAVIFSIFVRGVHAFDFAYARPLESRPVHD